LQRSRLTGALTGLDRHRPTTLQLLHHNLQRNLSADNGGSERGAFHVFVDLEGVTARDLLYFVTEEPRSGLFKCSLLINVGRPPREV